MAKKRGLFKKIAEGIKTRRTKRKEKRITKLGDKGVKVTTSAVKHKSELDPKGRIRKGAKSVKVTKGGAYASYDKKSKAAGSFRSSFAAARKSGAKTFKWDGRSYSTAVAKPAAKKAVAKKTTGTPGTLSDNPRLDATREARKNKNKVSYYKKKAATAKAAKVGKKNLKKKYKDYSGESIGEKYGSSIESKAKGGSVGSSIKTYSSGGYVEGK